MQMLLLRLSHRSGLKERTPFPRQPDLLTNHIRVAFRHATGTDSPLCYTCALVLRNLYSSSRARTLSVSLSVLALLLASDVILSNRYVTC